MDILCGDLRAHLHSYKAQVAKYVISTKMFKTKAAEKIKHFVLNTLVP
jgi:hypothetical protein